MGRVFVTCMQLLLRLQVCLQFDADKGLLGARLLGNGAHLGKAAVATSGKPQLRAQGRPAKGERERSRVLWLVRVWREPLQHGTQRSIGGRLLLALEQALRGDVDRPRRCT